jgi:hypothetical protein
MNNKRKMKKKKEKRKKKKEAKTSVKHLFALLFVLSVAGNLDVIAGTPVAIFHDQGNSRMSTC